MDLTLTPEQEAFRTEVRAWLAANVRRLESPGTPDGFAAHRSWERALCDAGYAGLHWPVEYGGRGSDVITQSIFEEEYLLADAPERVNVVGHKLMAPTLFRHGTDEQKHRWLPPMLRGDEIWSQGFSEPDAGSDLAAMRTRAEIGSDELTVNGQKIWTSYGAFADWIFALVRTDPASERHKGLTFVAIDMKTPGVEARAITQLDGHTGFAEVFFTDVRVPVSNVVGMIGDGWTVAMTTLGAERDGPARPAARYMRDVRMLVSLARASGRANDTVARDRVAGLYARAQAYRLNTMHALTRIARGESIGDEASIQKLLWSELERDIWELALELADGSFDDDVLWSRYWYARAATIYAGTSEIQRNIIGERVLGLPR
jgi:alkylation response protein AidB-like acyl-CoA dehydrogenase